jgi:hypothetical protein
MEAVRTLTGDAMSVLKKFGGCDRERGVRCMWILRDL